MLQVKTGENYFYMRKVSEQYLEHPEIENNDLFHHEHQYVVQFKKILK